MELATPKDGSHDDQLAAISCDLKTAHLATHIAGTLQCALDDWAFRAPQLQDLYDQLNAGHARHPFAFDTANCMAPLPRAYRWADDSAYLDHVELVRRARGAEMPPEFWADPLMYQGGSDGLTDAYGPIIYRSEAFGIDFETEVAVITGGVPMGTEAATTAGGIHLIMLANDVSLRNLIPAEPDRGFGFFQNKPTMSFSPVAIVPDELDGAWRERKIHLLMTVRRNNKKVGQPGYGTDMIFNFGQLIAHIYKTHNVRANSIAGSGTVSNVDHGRGYACIAERRMLETIEFSAPITEYMRYGDTVKIGMFDANDVSIFGVVGQEVVAPDAQT